MSHSNINATTLNTSLGFCANPCIIHPQSTPPDDHRSPTWATGINGFIRSMIFYMNVSKVRKRPHIDIRGSKVDFSWRRDTGDIDAPTRRLKCATHYLHLPPHYGE